MAKIVDFGKEIVKEKKCYCGHDLKEHDEKRGCTAIKETSGCSLKECECRLTPTDIVQKEV